MNSLFKQNSAATKMIALKTIFVVYLSCAFLLIFIIQDFEFFVLYDYAWSMSNLPNGYFAHFFGRINLIPFDSIGWWISGTINDMLQPKIAYYNLVFPIVFAIPYGFLNYLISSKKRFLKSYLYFLLVICLVFILRLSLTIGFFDIDKVILCSLGYIMGYYFAVFMLMIYRKISFKTSK